jgi:hypothetical protein
MHILNKKVKIISVCVGLSFASSSWCSLFVRLYYDPKIKKNQQELDRILAERNALFVRVIREKNWPEIRSCCEHDWHQGCELPYYIGLFAALEAGHGDVARYLAFDRPNNSERSLYGLFYASILFGGRTVFDFLVRGPIDVNRSDPEDRNKNAINYWIEGRERYGNMYGQGPVYGSGEDREYIRQFLESRGVTPNALAPAPGEGGCCEVM